MADSLPGTANIAAQVEVVIHARKKAVSANVPRNFRWWVPTDVLAQLRELREHAPGMFKIKNFLIVLGQDWWCWALPTKPQLLLDRSD